MKFITEISYTALQTNTILKTHNMEIFFDHTVNFVYLYKLEIFEKNEE